jgi:hypothetical protein
MEERERSKRVWGFQKKNEGMRERGGAGEREGGRGKNEGLCDFVERVYNQVLCILF